MQVFVPVSQCKDTTIFDITNNYFKKDEEKRRPSIWSPSVRNLPNYSTDRSCQALFPIVVKNVSIALYIIASSLLVRPFAIHMNVAHITEEGATLKL